jgi:hypothetical protein
MKAEYAYIGINAAGQVRAISMDDPGAEQENAKLICEWLAMGRTVERVPIAEAKARMSDHDETSQDSR